MRHVHVKNSYDDLKIRVNVILFWYLRPRVYMNSVILLLVLLFAGCVVSLLPILTSRIAQLY